MQNRRTPINQTLYFIESDFGRHGRAFIEIDRDRNSRQSVIDDIVSGCYRDVLTVLEVNPVEGRCRDVTEEIFAEVIFIRELRAIIDVMSADDRQAAKFDHARDLRKNFEVA